MGNYRKKVVEIEAFQLGHGNMPAWFTKAIDEGRVLLWPDGGNYIEILTEKGTRRGYRDDYVIKATDASGSIYIVKPKTFFALYESTETPAEACLTAVVNALADYDGEDEHVESAIEVLIAYQKAMGIEDDAVDEVPEEVPAIGVDLAPAEEVTVENTPEQCTEGVDP